ncbi:MAG: hypothetical protein A3E81_02175 [Gammaproteobacteria bacterium RIFCSPHIGHO2_12_FULL_36_30]|nr:MAG: hypothetical protein A3E81_02175 [Gammaproteobacteria bacterium RIFCSPHIGHO2_12_FULL_36_30]
MQTTSSQKLSHHLKLGYVYRREDLLAHSKAVDRDLITLSDRGVLEKVAPGLYYAPKTSRFGTLPPNENVLVKAFLKDNQFLLVSWNAYNALGLGLTQVYNRTIVYNHKRHGIFKLANQEFDFRRPAYGFPKKMTKAYLLVDLLNNADELFDEDSDALKTKIKSLLSPALLKIARIAAKKYGKVATKKFLGVTHGSVFT